MKRELSFLVLLVAGCSSAGTTSEVGTNLGAETEAVSNKDFDMSFENCTAFAGIAHVSAAKARELVPPEYDLLLENGAARMVVRVAHCTGTVVDGKATGDTIISHIGITLVGPDPSVTLNNYTLWYATDNARLHARLKAAGAPADMSNALRVTYGADTSLSISSSSPHTPSFTVVGTAAAPTGPTNPTSASWWDDGVHGQVRSRTTLPGIRFGVAHTTLTTPAGSDLADLIGGTTLTFDALDSYNPFPSGIMEVRLNP